MKYGNLTLGQIEALANKLGGMGVVMSVLRGTSRVIVTTVSYIVSTFIVAVDETKTVEELVTEGVYDAVEAGVTSENFPRPLFGMKVKKDVILFNFGKRINSEQVIAEMSKEGCRPANTHELLALGIAQPELGKEFPVISIGSVCCLDGHRYAVRICGGPEVRHIGMSCVDTEGDWLDICQFAGVR
ncbi:hypothetical protein A2996_01125 [Candidatus Campbellbacteria bacterium RIFCSPLOWO2_01_FULL_34_15]|uniref:Uncharacterized protein n=1 Tax=Candidatus Campbellbacteria bacterium RIFCSPLOWO2_01_FULL_34_15 TaxID=1797579 RepID=A0A1F5EMA5_9BACT|nr:MAG: hypothetical protein A2996_01125 [Candidatus Campbellbacteria bacterium RIFCSPLOWO2_01_FULL_34_15]